MAELRAKHPALRIKPRTQPGQTIFQQAAGKGTRLHTASPFNIAKSPALAASNVTLWGNCMMSANYTYNYYSFTPTSAITFNPLAETNQDFYVGNYGVEYKDGHIRGISADLSLYEYGLIFEYYNDLDLETGECSSETITDYALMATETAQAADGTIYGAFYNDDLDGIELGTINYSKRTRTTIATTDHFYIAMGITKAGVLYGIAAEDGNLYKIDTTNGAETLVGNTGITISDDEGYYYGQSGEIDQKDDTFYWYSIDANNVAALYTVDLETAAVTKISDVQQQVFGLIVYKPDAEDGAPAKIDDLTADFSSGSLTGQLHFTAPYTAYCGANIAGALTYKVYEDGEVIATGATSVGTATTVSITAQKGGLHTYYVSTSNATGESPKASVTAWVGLDTPNVVSNLKLSIDDNQLVTLTWDAPTTGTHGGGIGNLTYDVYRVNDNHTETVATNLTATTVTDQIESGELTYYVYKVYAKNSSYTSAAATSDGKLVGDAIQPDWTEDFLTASAMNFFTVIDANQDGVKWGYDTDEQAARSWYSNTNGNDDWLITPPLHLKADRSYTFSFSAKNKLERYANSMEVKWGNAATPEALTTTLLETTTPGIDFTEYSYEVQPTTEGDYYFGFHDNTPTPEQYFISIGYVSVKANALPTAPDSVTALKVTPAAEGDLSATISFNAPTKLVNGQPLTAIDSIVVSRNGNTIKLLETPKPGQSLTFEDNVTTSGTYEYTITAYADGEYGRTAKAAVYIGMDVPQEPTGVVLRDNVTNVIATWDAFSNVGANGGYVDPSEVEVSLYEIERLYGSYYVGDLVASSGEGETSITLDLNPEENPDGDDNQKLLQYFALASNSQGESEYVGTHSLVVGPTLSLPYKESFPNGNLDSGFAWLEQNEQSQLNNDASWLCVTTPTADNDGGSAVWTPYMSSYQNYNIVPGDEASLNTPKISLAGAAKPQLYFSLFAKAYEKAKLKVVVLRPDGTEATLYTYDLSKIAETGWETHQLSLADYSSERYIIVKFRGVCEGNDTYIGIDNINVYDQKDNDLKATSISVPTKLTAGTKAKVVVGVQNLGAKEAKDFSVVLYAQNEPVDTVTVTSPLASIAETSVTLDLPVKITASDAMKIRAQVEYDADLNTSNNSTETKTVTVEQPKAVTVSDLSAADNGGVALSWSKPTAPEGETVTETFEDYDNFVTEFGDWTTVDSTESTINAGYFAYNSYEHQGEQFAFIIFNPSEYEEGYNALQYLPGLGAHEGYKYAACPRKQSTLTFNYVDGNSWLISPSLSGNEQTISLYAYNIYYNEVTYAEQFDVLYSTTDKQPSSFTKIGQTLRAAGTEYVGDEPNWTEFSVDLPKGAKYFAIHHITPSEDNFLFGIDDVTYEKGTVLDEIVGYNIYRDGELVATVDAQSTAYTDTEDDGQEHTYNVTVIYQDANGDTYESAFSNSATIATSIEAIESALRAATYDVYTLDGRAVKLGAKSLDGLQKGIYIINDRKFILK